MDIEFHYYMTYLIASKAGFSPEQAKIIACSSQYVDDNCVIFEISKDSAAYYTNYISQTMNILKPKDKLFRIYPLFHFIPGDPLSLTARRADGKLHFLNTTPNSDNANQIIVAALQSDNLYRIGIASHAFVDTWAHQNFVGYYEEFNSMTGILQKASPNIGHADAGHNPDWPGLMWKDKRLIQANARIVNKNRFIDAAVHLLHKYIRYHDSNIKQKDVDSKSSILIADLDEAIGGRDQSNDLRTARIEKYKKLGEQKNYNEREVPEYDEHMWLEEALQENVRGLRDISDDKLSRLDPFTDIYSWRNSENYKQTNWYKFQEAVKAHQEDAWNITDESTFRKMELESL